MSLLQQFESFWGAFESGDLDAIFRDHVAADCEFVMPGMPPLRGPEQIRPVFAAWREAFSGMRHQTLHAIESGDTYAGETRYTARHTGPLPTPQGPLPPTHREVRWTSADILRFRGGRIVSWHVHHDPSQMLG